MQAFNDKRPELDDITENSIHYGISIGKFN